jgi:hypothetical protein
LLELRKVESVEFKQDLVEYKIASTKDEFKQAFQLLHDKYVSKGYMNPCKSGMRYTIHNALPKTCTIIAKHANKVIGCISIIPDSEFGLPMDEEYKKELDSMRNQQANIVEQVWQLTGNMKSIISRFS